MNIETGRNATSFYLDCALTAAAAVGGATAAAVQVGGILIPVLAAFVGFYLAVLVLGILHRFGVSPGQLTTGGERTRSERSIFAHATIFASGVTMTLIFAVGCGLFQLLKPVRAGI